jgi:hypothetical protein
MPENILQEQAKLSPQQLREKLEEMILLDLLGPADGEYEEVDDTSVSERYLVGVLAPRIRKPTVEELPEQQDEIAITDKGNTEEGNTEKSTPAGDSLFPSSIGLTFCVEGTVNQIQITAQWGKYERAKSEVLTTEKDQPKTVWKRYPIQGILTQTLTDNSEFKQIVAEQEAPAVFIEGRMRRLPNNDWIVTVFLINDQTEPEKSKDTAWLFQPKLIIESTDKNKPDIFERKPFKRNNKIRNPDIIEKDTMAMLYRNQVEFAVGHGVGVHAEVKENCPHRAIYLSTEVVPRHEVRKTTPPTVEEIPALDGLVVDMKDLSESDNGALIEKLQPLTIAYKAWIDQQEQLFHRDPSLSEQYGGSPETAIANCRKTLERIEAGIEMLAENSQAADAFRFANQAMWQQRIHSILAESKRRGNSLNIADIDSPKNRSWYPFQLAFILLNLPSVTDLHHPDRSHPTNAIADLLWFPTGGGKTEAYLGLSAYTMGLRRLQGIIGGRDGRYGVAVLMRYTLRLLTLQQFQRATALICACEVIRRQNEAKWGQEPFRIGLWVGQGSTPNYTSQSEDFIKKIRTNDGRNRSGSPHQLTNCPWCGSEINQKRDITVDGFSSGRGQTIIKCSDKLGQCAFSKGDGLPVVVVDEEIYRRLPTLLIATVDKFAQMPWKGEVQMLFGQVSGYCDRHGFTSPSIEDSNHRKTGKLPATKLKEHIPLRPPDLIIQDELHLISGPLGTLVGLYETAVDALCTWEVDGQPIRPKVIASTATIRQAQSQVYHLFLRKLHVFPPQCLDIADNFFSRQRHPTETPGRRYLGICAPGRRLKAAIIRVYLAALASAQTLYEDYGTDADPWMTLVGYFNSLRELGGTRRLVDDDITTRLGKMDRRGLKPRSLNYNSVDELTSRKDSTDIPILLDKLEIPFDPNNTSQKPLDIILATNMISVGVDVKRLGLMVVNGQPKNTAEYIQATSRVGRTYPGLVLTVYNWARPRDLSHYERFEHYHATFYQHVEALSVTPFSAGALDRGLFALLVSLIRLQGEDFNHNDAAREIERNHPSIQMALDAIIHRTEQIEGKEAAEQTKMKLNAKLDLWLSEAQNRQGGRKLVYKMLQKDGVSVELLKAAEQGRWQDFSCLNSLRNVEPTIGMILTDNPPDDDTNRQPQPFIKSGERQE